MGVDGAVGSLEQRRALAARFSQPRSSPSVVAKMRAALHVGTCEPVETHLYLAPGADKLQAVNVKVGLPPCPPGTVRVVCISDTHNEHAGLRLPEGDVLLHTGDVLTESGLRHVVREAGTGKIVKVQQEGVALLENFACWFGEQPFAHKVVIGGNHDLVLQGLGKERVQAILSERCCFGEAIYLEDEEVTVGSLRIYGSPFADYHSHNDAFKVPKPVYRVQPGVHIVLTHHPCVLPHKNRGLSQDPSIAGPLLRAGALLHVSGHCHWANGLYFAGPGPHGPSWPEDPAQGFRVPCVVASVCGSTWLGSKGLLSATGERGDPADGRFGGYNLHQPGIVCDIQQPELSVPETLRLPPLAAPPQVAAAVGPPAGSTVPRPLLEEEAPAAPTPSQALLFFCPPNDAELVQTLLPRLAELFRVVHVETVAEGVRAVGEQEFAACVSKLGTEGNMGWDVLSALRAGQGSRPVIVVHSATAAGDERTREALQQDFGVALITEHGKEETELLTLLAPLAVTTVTPPFGHRGSLRVPPGDPNQDPAVLFFCPPTDAAMARSLIPKLRESFKVVHVETAAKGVRAVSQENFVACISKLGFTGNMGRDVLAALRQSQGRGPLVVIHSATAAASERSRTRLDEEFGVDLFTEHGKEEDIMALLAPLRRRGAVPN